MGRNGGSERPIRLKGSIAAWIASLTPEQREKLLKGMRGEER